MGAWWGAGGRPILRKQASPHPHQGPSSEGLTRKESVRRGWSCPPVLASACSSARGPLPVGPGCWRGGDGLTWALEMLALCILAWGRPRGPRPQAVRAGAPTEALCPSRLESPRPRCWTQDRRGLRQPQPCHGVPASPSGPHSRHPDTGERAPLRARECRPQGQEQN